MMKGVAAAAAVAVVAMMVLFVHHGEAAVSCGTVDAALAPCISYLKGSGADKPSEACCEGVKKVKALSVTTADKRAACACVKQAAIGLEGLQDKAAQALPTKCDVELDTPVSRTVDCDKIAFGIEAWME